MSGAAGHLARNLQIETMTKTATSPYDVAEHLRTPEEMAAYLDACMEEAPGDAASVAKALGDIRPRQGDVAGLLRCRPVPGELDKALSGERNLTLDTVLRVVDALGLELRVDPALDSDAAGQGASSRP